MRLRHVIITLVVWGLVLGTAYIITAVRIDRAKNAVRDSGIEMIHELSKLVSLPLLDSNAQTIHEMLVYSVKKTDMVHAAVVNHQDEIVTFVGSEQLTPAIDLAVDPRGQVSFWEGELPDHMKIFGFASDVIYSGIKIGRIQIALSSEKLLRVRNQFIIVAVSSCLLVLLLIAAIHYYPGIWAIPVRRMNIYQRDQILDIALESSLVTCPLCGAQKPFSEKLFTRSNFGRLLIIKASLNKSGASGSAKRKGMRLSDLAKQDEFSWFTRRILSRSAEIIKKLTA
jgi:hypothetical protein